MVYSKELQDFFAHAGVHCFIIDFTFGWLHSSWLPTIEKIRHNWPLDCPATIVYWWDVPLESYKPAMTLKEAQKLNLPAMHPTVEIHDSADKKDGVDWHGKIEISEDIEWNALKQARMRRI